MRFWTFRTLILMLAVLGIQGGLRAQTFRDAGTEAYNRGDYQVAVKLFEKSLATASKVMNEDDVDLVERRVELGEAYRAAGRWEDAITQLDYAWKRARYDADSRKHWREMEGEIAVGAAEKLSKACFGAARYDDSAMVCKTSLGDMERVGRLPDALQFGAILVEAQFQAHRPDDEVTATIHHVAELCLKMTGDLPIQARTLQQLAALCLRQRLPDAAKPLAARALELAVQASATPMPAPSRFKDLDEFPISKYQETLASALIATDGLDEADKLLSAATKEILTKETSDSPRLIDILLDESALDLKRNTPTEALTSAQQALSLSRRRFREMHPQTARSLAQVARCHLALNEPEEARPLFAEALSVFGKTLGEDDRDTQEIRVETIKLGPRLNPAKSSAAPGSGR